MSLVLSAFVNAGLFEVSIYYYALLILAVVTLRCQYSRTKSCFPFVTITCC